MTRRRIVLAAIAVVLGHRRGRARVDGAQRARIPSADLLDRTGRRCRATGTGRDGAGRAKASGRGQEVRAAEPTAPSRSSAAASLVWIAAELHLLFAAFVLAVPIFAFIIELIGYMTGDKRYDRLAYEFTKLLSMSFSLTATFGGLLTFMLIILYPKFTNYLMRCSRRRSCRTCCCSSARRSSSTPTTTAGGSFIPLVHLGLGLGLNVVGTAIMVIANAWLTFMMTPQGVSARRRADRPLRRVRQLHLDADQHPPLHRQHRLRRIDRRRLRGLEVPAGDDRRGARALRLDGLHRQLRRDQRLPAAALRRLLPRQGDLRLLPGARASR